MPINFVTGLPRQGKTLFTFIQVQKRAKEESRKVFYCNIPEVTLPGWTEIDHPDKWMDCPDDSIIVVDELQDFWGAASPSQKVPPPILELSKHGKRGIDFYFITQDPTLVHNTPRKLCETHWHVSRAFGTENAIAYKFKGMQTDPSKVKNKAEQYPWRYPKEAFGKKDKAGNWITRPWYKSADVHNIKRNIPLKVWAMPLGVVIAIGAAYFAVTSVLGFGSKVSRDASKVVPGAVPPSAGASAAVVQGGAAGGRGKQNYLTYNEYLDQRKPRIPDFPHTAPAYDQVTAPVVAPYPAACVKMGADCKCYTQQATLLVINVNTCLQIVKQGFFIDWAQAQQGDKQGQQQDRRETRQSGQRDGYQVVSTGQYEAPRSMLPGPQTQHQQAPQPPQPGDAWSQGLARRNAEVRSTLER